MNIVNNICNNFIDNKYFCSIIIVTHFKEFSGNVVSCSIKKCAAIQPHEG